ncbi:MAG: hypothetical protein SGJ27_28705 [Candidatus Melainabacteria bacterium]|nr:hypothetical protein [Candidatus Melainabacteria bacterium]
MKNTDTKELIKYVGGGLIVIVAFGIMAPGLVNYLMGLGRVFTLIASILAAAFLIVFFYHRLKPKQKEPEQSFDPQDDIE